MHFQKYAAGQIAFETERLPELRHVHEFGQHFFTTLIGIIAALEDILQNVGERDIFLLQQFGRKIQQRCIQFIEQNQFALLIEYGDPERQRFQHLVQDLVKIVDLVRARFNLVFQFPIEQPQRLFRMP